MSDKSSIEWTDATCRPCGAVLNSENIVERGRRLCKECKNKRVRAAYVPKGPPERSGPTPSPARDGDKRQARKRVNQLVMYGKLPRPADLPCVDCGHKGPDRRHEYDHHKGYAAAFHETVEAVCSRCHHRRSIERGERTYV